MKQRFDGYALRDLIKSLHDRKNNLRRHSAQIAYRSAKSHCFFQSGDDGVGRPHSARAERMDLLDHISQEAGDEKNSYRAGARGDY